MLIVPAYVHNYAHKTYVVHSLNIIMMFQAICQQVCIGWFNLYVVMLLVTIWICI